MDYTTQLVRDRIEDSIGTKKLILENSSFVAQIADTSILIADTLKNGGRLLLAGNGGSASDCLHIAGELVGRFQKERAAYSAIVLNADVASLTAIANDYGYDEVFSRQIEAHMRESDVFLGISTSGNSVNVIKAVQKAKALGGKTICLSGKDGGTLANMVDYALVVPSEVTARIQESHIMIIHIICEIVENRLFDLDRSLR